MRLKKIIVWTLIGFFLVVAGLAAMAYKMEMDFRLAVCKDHPGTKYNGRTSSCDPTQP